MTATMRQVGQVDALVTDEIAALSSAQRDLLASMIGRPFMRMKGGYRARGDFTTVQLATMERLIQRKLVSDLHGKAQLTWHGKLVAQEIRDRKKKAKAS